LIGGQDEFDLATRIHSNPPDAVRQRLAPKAGPLGIMYSVSRAAIDRTNALALARSQPKVAGHSRVLVFPPSVVSDDARRFHDVLFRLNFRFRPVARMALGGSL
jgi:hypothetical protein